MFPGIGVSRAGGDGEDAGCTLREFYNLRETARTLTPTEEVCWKILDSGLSALPVPPLTVTLGEPLI